MNNKNIKIKYLLSLVLIIVFSVFSFEALAIWTPPSFTPPTGNTIAPLNIGSSNQQKTGALILQGGFRSIGPVVFDLPPYIPISGFGEGKVLTSDAGGNATWQTPAGGGGGAWTRDSANAVVRLTNNNDKVGLGLTNPTEQLEITNNFRLPNTTDSTTGVIYKGSTRFIHDRGTENIFLGHNAGNFSLTGQRNVGTGFNSLLSNTSGSDNTAVGYRALESNTTGNFNTGIGIRSLDKVVGSSNTAIGDGVALMSQYNNNFDAYNHSNNTWFMRNNNGTSYHFLNGNDNTVLGNSTGLSSGVVSNTVVIGDWMYALTSNKVLVGKSNSFALIQDKWGFNTQNFNSTDAFRVGTTTSNGNGARLTTTGTWTSTSDLNKKTNIKNLSYGLKDVLKLRPVNFDWKESKQGDIGFIAQEVKKVIPELVNGEEGDLALSYANMTTVLTRAIQEQQQEIEEYKKKIDIYTDKIIELENIKSKINE